MAVQSRSLTYADLLRLRETRDERLELIEGDIVVTPAPVPLHLVIVHRLAVVFDGAIPAGVAGVIMQSPDVSFSDHSVYQPDLVVLLRDRMEQFGSRKVEGAPSLVVEVLSPSTSARDLGIKKDAYAQHGVPEYWIVDGDARAITVCSDPVDGRYRSESTFSDIAVSATIPQVSVDLGDLFAPVPGI
jgi:Uma2 family endonuclease